MQKVCMRKLMIIAMIHLKVLIKDLASKNGQIQLKMHRNKDLFERL
jgi:hypothetical protein